jgi:hypothetical protein
VLQPRVGRERDEQLEVYERAHLVGEAEAQRVVERADGEQLGARVERLLCVVGRDQRRKICVLLRQLRTSARGSSSCYSFVFHR